MGTYIILSRISPNAFSDPADFKKLASTVSDKIKSECPNVTWKESFVTLGRFDVVDVIESDDMEQVGRAALIIRAFGKSETETLVARDWKDFLNSL